MQLLHSLRQKNLWLLFVIMLGSLFLLPSCKNKKVPKGPVCVKLTKKHLQKWVEAGYTKPGDPKSIVTVRFRTAYAFPGTDFRVFAEGFNSAGELVQGSLTELTPDDICKNADIKLPDFIFIGVVPATLEELELIDKNTGEVMKNLEYLQLMPFKYYDPGTKFDMLAYEPAKMMSNGTQAPLTMEATLLPCPPCPNCKEPCPPPTPCIAPCREAQVDSTDNQQPAIN